MRRTRARHFRSRTQQETFPAEYATATSNTRWRAAPAAAAPDAAACLVTQRVIQRPERGERLPDVDPPAGAAAVRPAAGPVRGGHPRDGAPSQLCVAPSVRGDAQGGRGLRQGSVHPAPAVPAAARLLAAAQRAQPPRRCRRCCRSSSRRCEWPSCPRHVRGAALHVFRPSPGGPAALPAAATASRSQAEPTAPGCLRTRMSSWRVCPLSARWRRR